MKLSFLLLAFAFPLCLFAQEDNIDTEFNSADADLSKLYKFSLKATGGIPFAISNPSFNNVFRGAYSGSLHADFVVYKSIYAGLYTDYSMFHDSNLRSRSDVTKNHISMVA